MWPIFRRDLVLFVCSSLLCLASQAQVLNWQYESIQQDIQEPGNFPNLAIDIQGNHHFTFWDSEIDVLFYARKDKRTGQITFERIPDSGTFGYRSAIKIAVNGDIHIAYLHNNNERSTLRHAIKNPAGQWQIEDATPQNISDVGIYGPDIRYPTFIQPSIEVFFPPSGGPGILYFDGSYTSIRRCDAAEPPGRPGQSYSEYELDMSLALKENGNWVEQAYPDIAYAGSVNCLATGDRYGEFCKMEQTSDGRYIAVTNSRHNHHLLLMISAPNDLSQWTIRAVDSTDRILSTGSSHFWESFGFIDTDLTGDSVLHVSYNLSNKYGVTSTFTNRQTVYYLQVHLDSLGDSTYQPIHYHVTPTNVAGYFTSLMTIGIDTVVEAFFERNEQALYTLTTTDGGQTWDQELISNFSTNGQLTSGVFEDSLFIYAYDNLNQRVLEFSKHKADINWQRRAITGYQISGSQLSATVERVSSSNDRIHLVATEQETDALNYWLRDAGQWSTTEIDTAGQEFGPVDMLLNANREPVVSFISEATQSLKFARLANGNWQVETVVDSLEPLELSMAQYDGEYYIFFFEGKGRNLRLARGNSTVGWNVEIIDNTSSIVGQRPHTLVEADGTLHVSYHDLIAGALRYAKLPPNGVWELDTVGVPGEFIPSDSDLAIRTDGLPVIAFRDGFRDSLFIASRSTSGDWVVNNILGDQNNLTGKPIRLILSQNDRPWVLYNYETVTTELRLVRLDGNGVWNRVSILNNSAEIGRSVEFVLVDRDFYVIGKQNQPNNNGLGLLYAADGISTLKDASIHLGAWEVYPNPATDILTLEWEGIGALPSELQVSLYNLQGQQWPLNIQANERAKWKAILPEVSSGLYVLQIQTKEGSVVQRLWVR